MNRNLEIFSKLYKPYRIEKKNNVYIFNTMEGNYAIKLNPAIDYSKLYRYLASRNFNYLPSITPDSKEDMVVFEYVENINMDNQQKILDLINLVSLLHNKTSYFKEVNNDKYKEIYQNIKNNIIYIDNYYNDMFMEYIYNDYHSPSQYLFLRNYSLIYNACKYCLDKIETWYLEIQDKNKQRIVLVHNNLKLEHLLKDKQEYLISWDNYTFDSPVLDLVTLYKNESEHISYKEALEIYCENFNLLDEEKILFNILISMPYKIDKNNDEYLRCRELRKLINYLSKSSSTIFNI